MNIAIIPDPLSAGLYGFAHTTMDLQSLVSQPILIAIYQNAECAENFPI